MKIIICGCGFIGVNIAKHLIKQGHEISMIDVDNEVSEHLSDRMDDITVITGLASLPNVLEDIGAHKTNMIIAVTGNDETNMVICQIAYSIFGIPHRIARIRKQHYFDHRWSQKLFTEQHVPITQILSPELHVAKSIIDKILSPNKVKSYEIVDTKYQIVAISCRNQNFKFLHNSIFETCQKLNIDIPIVLIRNHVRIDIDFDTVFTRYDTIYYITDNELTYQNLFLFNISKRRNVIIGGGGYIARHIISELHAEKKDINITIIERNFAMANQIASDFSDINLIHGDIMDTEILKEANVHKADLMITVTNNETVNVLSPLLAKKIGVKETISVIDNYFMYVDLISTLGIDYTVNPLEDVLSKLLNYTKDESIRKIFSLHDGLFSILQITISLKSKFVGHKASEMYQEEDWVILCIIRQGRILSTDVEIHGMDIIVIFSLSGNNSKIVSMF